MKFKVGDKVRVREGLEVGKYYLSEKATEIICLNKGLVFKIAEIDHSRGCYMLEGDFISYGIKQLFDKIRFTDEMLEPIEKKNCFNCKHNFNKYPIEKANNQCLKCMDFDKWEKKRAIKTVIRFDDKSCDTCINQNTYFDCSQCKDFDEWEKAEEKEDLVNHPKHYNMYRVEVIDIIEDATKELKGMEAVNLGHIIRYVLRYQFKNGVQDLKKARFYLDKQIKLLEDKQ